MHPTARQTCQALSLSRTRNLSPASARALRKVQRLPQLSWTVKAHNPG